MPERPTLRAILEDEPLLIGDIRRDLKDNPLGRGGAVHFQPTVEGRGGSGCPGDNITRWLDEIVTFLNKIERDMEYIELRVAAAELRIQEALANRTIANRRLKDDYAALLEENRELRRENSELTQRLERVEEVRKKFLDHTATLTEGPNLSRIKAEHMLGKALKDE